MSSHCSPLQTVFQGIWKKPIVTDFNGGRITSDAGAVLLAEVERKTGYLRGFAECFLDQRNQNYVEHELLSLISQRVLGLCLGYEDLNDHDTLRVDALFAAACGKADAQGLSRRRREDRGKALAGKATLNRLELSKPLQEPKDRRYKKIQHNPEHIERFFVESFLQGHTRAPEMLVIDLDATDDPLHGNQEGRFFHGYYRCYCYLPLYIFCGEHLLVAKLRPSGIDASAGALEEVVRIVEQIRSRWPGTRIVVRGDSGFCREDMMRWCESQAVHYVFGLAKNSRLVGMIRKELNKASRRWVEGGRKKAQRVYKDLRYRTLKTWSRKRRVVGKAEYTEGKANPRFVATSLTQRQYPAEKLYRKMYCARGEMENRIKEQQLWLFADRTSTTAMRANQLRLWFSSVAYLIMSGLRRVGLKGTELTKAQSHTIRVKLLKIGAQVIFSVRRIVVRMASSYPLQDMYLRVVQNLRQDTS